jgi:tetratricopeptide (TPR) repeat protein
METEAAQCISCHMPGRIYMGNDFRRDHSFRVPRPDLSLKYGTPNVCSDCHTDSVQWAADAIVKWYGPERQKHFSEALAFGRTRDPASIPGLIELAENDTLSPMARSTAIWYMSQMATQESVESIIKLLQDNDPFVRYTSAGSIEYLPPEQRRDVLEPLLSDEVRSVRIAAASAMADVPQHLISESAKSDFRKARDEFLKGVRVRSDFPGGQMELARYHEKTGRIDLAEQAYRNAIELDNYYNTARINLAGLLYGQQRFEEAEELFKKVIEQEPEYGQAYYSLGLLMAEQNRMLAAEQYLGQATEKMEDNPRVPYNYGLVLQRLGKRPEAEIAFQKGLQIDPYSVANLYALTYLYFEQNKLQEAYSSGQQLVNLDPSNENYKNLLAAIKEKLNVSN